MAYTALSETGRAYARIARELARPVTQFAPLARDIGIGIEEDAAYLSARSAATWAERALDAERRLAVAEYAATVTAARTFLAASGHGYLSLA